MLQKPGAPIVPAQLPEKLKEPGTEIRLSHLLSWSRRGGRGGSRSGTRRTMVDQILQLLAGFEERDLLGRDFHAFAGFRIAAHARLALPGTEAAEPANLDLVAHAQRAHDAVKDRLYNHFAVFPRELRQTRHLINQIRFCHTPLGSVMNFD